MLDCLPPHLWGDKRRKRSYINQVLARAERDSAYKPARKLWARTRNGHYLPNPAMLLRTKDGWLPVYEALNLSWIDQGCSDKADYRMPPMEMVRRLTDRLNTELF